MPRTDADPLASRSAAATPAVSVVIPAYNVAAYIGAALDSVFAQTFTDYETIVVNDGSPDTPELERALAPYRQRLVYLTQENQGPSSARNRGLGAARGEFVAFLDSDDMWHPEHLDAQVAALRRDPALDLVYADAFLFGEGVPDGLTFMRAAPSAGPATFESLLTFRCSILTTTVVARKEALLSAGRFDPRFFRSEDYDLWLRLAHGGGRIAYQRRILGYHRARAESLAADEDLMAESKIAVYRKVLSTLALRPEDRRTVERQIKGCRADIEFARGKRLFSERRFAEAAEALQLASDHQPGLRRRLVAASVRAMPKLLWRVYHMRRGALS